MAILWILMALLAAAAALSVLVPLYRGDRARAGTREAALAIYKDQLGEVDRDVARGLVAAEEADAARTEIARRLLKADAVREGAADSGSEPARRAASAVAIIVLPLAALAFYIATGSPDLPGKPLAARLTGEIDTNDVPALVGRIEAHLRAEPEDGQGWELLAPIYGRAGRYADAEKAFANAIRLLGSTVERETGLGEAIAAGAGGTITEAAQAAFRRAADLDPKAVRPRFFLAAALSQDGKTGEARAAWQALVDGAPADAAWVPAAREALARLDAVPAGPSAEAMAAAEKLPPAERQAMIEGMVGRLAARLEATPADPEGWAQLLRSYMVLGRKADAEAALTRARAALAGNAGGLATIEAGARAAGLVE